MKIFTKESAAFIVVAFIIWTILEIVYDLITGVTLAEMVSAKYVIGYLVSAIVFATVLRYSKFVTRKRKSGLT